MFAAYIRAAITLGIAVVVGVLLQMLVPPFLAFQGPEDGLLYQSFEAVAEYGILLMVTAIGVGLLARAVVESNVGVRR